MKIKQKNKIKENVYNNSKSARIGVKKMKVVDNIALALVVIGAINWGLIGIFNFDLVAAIFGSMSVISRIIYTLVGISGLWAIRLFFRDSH